MGESPFGSSHCCLVSELQCASLFQINIVCLIFFKFSTWKYMDIHDNCYILQSIDVSIHVTSDEKVWYMRALLFWFTENELTSLTNYPLFSQKEVQSWPCLWNGIQKPCYLFARKFTPETLDNLLLLFSNYSAP